MEFDNLGLVIVDEQHRFGVMQRLKLMRKEGASTAAVGAVSSEAEMRPTGHREAVAPEVGRPPHLPGGDARRSTPVEPDVLVMTATPIPRTLALTLYGDLDVSMLDELPPGRTPIVTRMVEDERAADVWDFVRREIAAGHQAYVVYPVIEENEERELKAAEQMHRQLREKVFP